MKNPYDAKQGGAKAMIRKVVISKPAKSGPYQTTKPTIKYVWQDKSL